MIFCNKVTVIILMIYVVEVLMNPVKTNPSSFNLSKDELECIKKTRIDVESIKRDKNFKAGDQQSRNPLLQEYFGCLIPKWRKVLKIKDTMSPYINVPGYRTKYRISNIKCDGNGQHVSGLPIPCVIV